MNDFISHFEAKVKQFTDEKRVLDDAECMKLGKKNAESYPFCSILLLPLFSLSLMVAVASRHQTHAVPEGHCRTQLSTFSICFMKCSEIF